MMQPWVLVLTTTNECKGKLVKYFNITKFETQQTYQFMKCLRHTFIKFCCQLYILLIKNNQKIKIKIDNLNIPKTQCTNPNYPPQTTVHIHAVGRDGGQRGDNFDVVDKDDGLGGDNIDLCTKLSPLRPLALSTTIPWICAQSIPAQIVNYLSQRKSKLSPLRPLNTYYN